MRATLKELANLKGADAIKYLMQHKQELMSEKKSMLKIAEPFTYQPGLAYYKDGDVVKADTGTVPEDADKYNVTVVANACWYRDSHGDVGISGTYNKTVKERGNTIPHIADHNHSIYSHIGDVQKVYVQEVALKELGLGKEGTTECLLFNTDVLRELNEQAFKLYKTGRVKQHSIALLYIKLSLAVNDKDYDPEYQVWKKYIDKVINKAETKDYGFFWAMEEIKVLENSGVLFGSNPLTPTLSTNEKSDTKNEPGNPTHEEPSQREVKSSINLGNLLIN